MCVCVLFCRGDKMPKSPAKLRIITYMCPSHPVEMYELLMNYLEEELDVEATLVYETRAGGPLPGRCDPFTDDTIDLGNYYMHIFEIL